MSGSPSHDPGARDLVQVAHKSGSDAMESIFPVSQKERLQEHYNRKRCSVEHRLHESISGDIPDLVALAARLPPDSAYYSTENAGIGDGWGREAGQRRSLQDTIATIGDTNSLVILKHVERDPEYGPLFDRVVAEIVDLIGPRLRDDMIRGRATLLISSPHRVTAYHIDAETNYLLQIAGEKRVSVFDQNDRTLITPQELEEFCSGNLNGAKYKLNRQQDAQVFDLTPGNGVHVPVFAPHWVQNGANVSISLSINYDLFSTSRAKTIYKANRRLRRAGLDPALPGQSGWRDTAKISAFEGVSYLKKMARLRGGLHHRPELH
jgi:hypothetical protein